MASERYQSREQASGASKDANRVRRGPNAGEQLLLGWEIRMVARKLKGSWKSTLILHKWERSHAYPTRFCCR